MKTWTIDEMRAENPCAKYGRARIADLWAGRHSLTLADILDLDIPAGERVWVACRPGALAHEMRRRWLDGIATRAVTTHARHCGVPAVEQWAVQWLDGTDRTAWAVEAARAPSRAAVEAAVEAAEAAARGAARGAARAAAWGAEAAEQDQQIADLRALMAEDGPGAS